MRIADKMNLEQVNSSVGKNRVEMADLQNQAATQKRVTKPSDDPLAATRILSTRTEIASGKQFQKSVTQAKNFLEFSEQSLAEMSEILNRVKELAISQSNDGSADRETRQAAATEVQQLHDEVIQVGNRKLGDRFLFAGFKTTQKPFDRAGRYSGDEGEINIAVQKEGQVAMNMPGNRIFLGKNVHGLSKGQIENLQKVETTPEQENSRERIESELGGHIRGPASVESSLANSRSSGTSESGKKTDSEINSGLRGGEVDGVNIFHVLQDLIAALNANDKSGVQESLDDVDRSLEQVVQARALLGSRTSTLNSALESLQKGHVENKAMVSMLEDADTFELVSDINKTETTLKASMAVSGKLIQPSLLDFLK